MKKYLYMNLSGLVLHLGTTVISHNSSWLFRQGYQHSDCTYSKANSCHFSTPNFFLYIRWLWRTHCIKNTVFPCHFSTNKKDLNFYVGKFCLYPMIFHCLLTWAFWCRDFSWISEIDKFQNKSLFWKCFV